MSVSQSSRRRVGMGIAVFALFALTGCHSHYRGDRGWDAGYYAAGYVDRLPRGYVTFRYDGRPHYFHDGRFYRRGARGYVVVRPPRGAFLRRLPRGARSYRRGGVEFKEYRGVEYERVREGRRRGYRVKGRAGRRGRR